MANVLFRKYLHAMMTGGSNIPNLSSANIKAALIDTGEYAPDPTITGDEYYDDISAGVIALTGNLTGVSVVDAVLSAADAPLIDEGDGEQGHVVVVFADTGTPSTSRLMAYLDTMTGLPLTLNGVNDEIRWDEQGIFGL